MSALSPDRQLRLECLRLAVDTHDPDKIAVARRFYAFVACEDDQTPRQRIDAALDAADVT